MGVVRSGTKRYDMVVSVAAALAQHVARGALQTASQPQSVVYETTRAVMHEAASQLHADVAHDMLLRWVVAVAICGEQRRRH